MPDHIDDRCTRCGLTGQHRGVRWPEGPICRRCYQSATRTRGTCPSCGETRLLPALSETRQPICVDCAGVAVDLRCGRCGDEDEPYRRGICGRCALTDDLTALFDDGSGNIHSRLIGLHKALTTQAHPRSAIVWLRNPTVTGLLADLAAGRVVFTHEAIDAYANQRATGHLRELLVATGALPDRDRHLAAFDTWLAEKLDSIDDLEQRQLVRRFATWHHQRRLREFARMGTLTGAQGHNAKQDITAAVNFLHWLADRGRTLASCQQQDVDAWLTTGPTTRFTLRTFFVWAQHKHVAPKLSFPQRKSRSTPVTPTAERDQHLRQLLLDAKIPLATRVAGGLLLLYAQPVTRVCRLRISDVAITPTKVTIQIGDSAGPVPEPLGQLVSQLVKERRNTNTAANSSSTWLFTGTRPGQPLNRTYLMTQLRNQGINILGARNAALRQLTLDMPPAIAAASLGYSHQVAERHAAAAGATWAAYSTSRASSTTDIPRNRASQREASHARGSL